jgi:cyclopropane fatty-acyl-phospholipid synthase-like methyltransferase
VSARRVLETVFPGDKKGVRLADLGCLEGGYAVEFARIGFQVLGVEVRESNMVACNYVKSKTKLENLEFVKDDAWNIGAYGMFDAIFCCGLFYHLDRPKEFLHLLSSVTKKNLILQTHFATDSVSQNKFSLSAALRRRNPWGGKFNLSGVSENEGLPGRWYSEFADEKSFSNREAAKWASWDNRRSFWIQREYLLQALKDAGFDLVMEQFDSLGPNIAESMTRGYYRTDLRGTFIGIKT